MASQVSPKEARAWAERVRADMEPHGSGAVGAPADSIVVDEELTMSDAAAELFMETSASTGERVEDTFFMLFFSVVSAVVFQVCPAASRCICVLV